MFDSPDVSLAKFTAKYRKTISIGLIPKPDLEHWRKWTNKTGGALIPVHMSPEAWGDSIGSLQTAAAIVGAYTPSSLRNTEYFQATLPRLHRRILLDIKRNYDRGPHGSFRDRVEGKPKPKR